MLTIAGGVPDSLSRFCSAINPPKFVLVFAHDASSIAASGAAALAHSTSIAASASSALMPGSVQGPPVPGAGFTCVNWPDVYPLNPNTLRNLAQSLVLPVPLLRSFVPCRCIPQQRAG